MSLAPGHVADGQSSNFSAVLNHVTLPLLQPKPQRQTHQSFACIVGMGHFANCAAPIDWPKGEGMQGDVMETPR